MIRSISILTSGTVLAQLIPLIAAPFISRLFNAEEFGEFAAVMAIVQIVTVAVNGRYELAIVLPKNNSDALALLRGSWIIGGFSVLVIVLCLIVFLEQISEMLSFKLSGYHVLAVFLALLGVLVWQPINYYFIRQRAYVKMTKGKFVKSLSLVGFTLFFGYFSELFNFNGLLLGFVICWILLGLFSIYQIRSDFSVHLRHRKQRMWINLKRYSSYPKFNLFPSFLNSFASKLGLYVFIFFFTTEVAGHYSFAKQYLYGPMSILGVSLSQVFFQRVSEKFQNKLSVSKELKTLFFFLTLSSLVIVIIIALFSVPIFEVVFGSDWTTAASMSKLLIISFAVQFIVSPLSTVLHALNRVKLASVFPIIYLVSLSALFLLPKLELNEFLQFYILAELIPYLIYLGIIIWAISKYESSIMNKS